MLNLKREYPHLNVEVMFFNVVLITCLPYLANRFRYLWVFNSHKEISLTWRINQFSAILTCPLLLTFFAGGHFSGRCTGTAREHLNQVEKKWGCLVHAVLVVFTADATGRWTQRSTCGRTYETVVTERCQPV